MSRAARSQFAALIWMLAPLWALILCYALKYLAGCRPVADSGFCDRFGGAELGSFATLLWYFAILGWVVTIPTGLIAILALALGKRRSAQKPVAPYGPGNPP